MFKKNDYIVLLNKNCANHKANFCYKQRQNSDHIQPYKDNVGNTTNGSTVFYYKHEENWRYANSQEIAEYNRIGKPYDVTTLKTIRTLNKDTVKVGQKVRVIAEDARTLGFEGMGNNDNFKKGYVGIITNINGGDYIYDNNHLWAYIDGKGGIITGLLELLEEPKSKEVISEKEPEVLVFGKFKIGSIVVSTSDFGNRRKEGGLFKVFPNSTYDTLFYSQNGYNTGTTDTWRQATPEEIKAFESGITNIKDMKKEEDLVGRYIKALKDSPQNTGIKKDNFTKITYDNGHNYSIDNGCAVSKVNLPTDWELMPVGFNPSEVKGEHSFYVKYEPAFTEDIFNKLKEWCNKNIPNIKWYNHVFGDKYADFAFGKYPYFRCFYDQPDKFYCCGVDNNKQNAKKQLSLSELCTLIGYKPEVDKHFRDYSFKGKWIQAAHWGSTSFAKCDYFTEGVVYFTECIRDGVYTEVSTWWGNSQEPNRLKEVSLLEIQKYLPEGHVDKIPNTSEEFKVGDWVIGWHAKISEGYRDNAWKITELIFDNNGRKIIHVRPQPGYSTSFEDIRKATPEEIAKAQKLQRDRYIDQAFTSKYTKEPWTVSAAYSEEYPIFAEPKKQKYQFSEVEYLAKPINQQLDLPIVKKYKKKSIINL